MSHSGVNWRQYGRNDPEIGVTFSMVRRAHHRSSPPGRATPPSGSFMNKRSVVRSTAVAALAAGSVLAGAGTGHATEFYFSPEQRIYTLAEQPQCLGGTVDVKVNRNDSRPNIIAADFTTHLYNPAWSGSANYECFLTIDAAWRNHTTGASGVLAHQVASWRFQGPNIRNPYVDIDTGAGPVTVTFTTRTAHAPSPTFEVPAI